MRGRHSTQGGFTVIEVSVIVALMAMATAVFMRNFSRVHDFAAHQRAGMRNLVAQQRSLRTLEAILQAVDPTTMTGADETGAATALEFRRWLHDPVDGVTLGPTERLEWRAGGDAVGEIAAPGQVVLVRGTDLVVVADRVPAGGFSLQMEGRQVVVDLETFYATDAQTIARDSVRRAVFLGRGDE